MNFAHPFKFETERSAGLRRSHAEEIALQKDEVHSWNGNRLGMTIEAREGKLWLTQCGDNLDIILFRGQSFRVNRPGRVVAQSLAPSTRVVTCG